MTLSRLALECLNSLCDDYENAASVTSGVRQFVDGNVPESEIRDCLAELRSNGWESAYKFDPDNSSFDKVDHLGEDWSMIWFFITDEGRKALDQNWVDD